MQDKFYIIKELKDSIEYFTVSEIHRDDLIEYAHFGYSDDEMEALASKLGDATPYWDSMVILDDRYPEHNARKVLADVIKYLEDSENYHTMIILQQSTVYQSLMHKHGYNGGMMFYSLPRQDWLVLKSIISFIIETINEKGQEDSSSDSYSNCKFLLHVCDVMLGRIKQ